MLPNRSVMMAAAGDFYSVLGVEKSASDKDIKAAFRKLAHEFHPDRAGNDPAAAERFKAVREAYETLSDAAKRSAYDRRHERRSNNSPFYGSHWKNAGQPTGGGFANKATTAAGNNVDLEDIFNDFGGVDFGFGKKGAAKAAAAGNQSAPRGTPRTRAEQWDPIRDFKEAAARESWPGAGEGGGAPGAGAPRDFGAGAGWSSKGGPRPAPRPEPSRSEGPAEAGGDVFVEVPLSSVLLGVGGLVTVEYDRTIRAEGGDGLLSIRELHELRVPPDVRDGDELRVPKHGHAGARGGPYGDLVARIHVVATGPRMRMPPREPSRAEDVVVVDVPFTEAILGGRVEVETPQGRVRISIPAGTSSGTRLRLKQKGRADASGTPADAYAEIRVTVPKALDEESRRLIERFAELNPPEG